MMSKQPCHITDEKGDHIHDPADAPNATFQQYIVMLPVTGYVHVTCDEQNELEAIAYAIDNRSEWDVSDLETDITSAEVEEI